MHPILMAELTRLHSEELLRSAEDARRARLATRRGHCLKAAIGTRLVSAGSRLLEGSAPRRSPGPCGNDAPG